jgi:photosystem II stability/assembly factor-like uncharacterized protein
LNVESLAADPLSPEIVYAGTNVGVYKTLDSGEDWFPANDGIGSVTVSLLAIDPVTPSTIYAVDSRITSPSGTLFKSTNGGSSWSRIDAGLSRPEETGFAVQALAIDPTLPSRIYAGKLSNFSCLRCLPGPGGLFRSTDGGRNWDEIATPIDFDSGVVGTLAVASTSPPTVLAGVRSGFGRSGAIFVSTSAGETWDRRASEFAAPVLSLAAPSAPETAYAGLGANFLGSGASLLKTTNAGQDWKARDRGIVSVAVGQLEFAPTDPRILFAATNAGLFRSNDAGTTWSRFVPNGLDFGGAYSVVVDPTTASRFYVLENDAILRITDDGEWRQLNVPPFYFAAVALAIDPRSPSTLYAGAADLGGTLGPGVLRSGDGGLTWQKRSVGLPGASVNTLVVDSGSSSTIYAAPTLYGIYKSTDAALSWTPAGSGAPGNVRAIAIDPALPAILYAAADTGLFRSADAGATWTPVGGDGLRGIVYSVVIDPGDPTHVYAAACSTVYRSLDRGLTWASIGAGPCVQALAVQPAGQTLYGGTLATGVWATTFLARADRRDEHTRVLPFRR